ncbi:amino acid transporter [Parathielavia hyrcaniae]|uniref:Amino acid transporter n=1 Tax=Parathielavia hyrcaniae TaxID=113614 RepID=A0AAN6Q7S4_9PEZI|nr:amino acid transporter [Parathielavia hyrcaniae]
MTNQNDTPFAQSESAKIGVAGAVLLTPSSIFAATGSVGISLLLWAVAGLLTLSGLSVYLEFGLAIPRSGGEKNYLERILRRPRHLATSIFAVQIVLLGFSAGNSLAFGLYVLLAAGHPMPDGWIPQAIAVACVTFVLVLLLIVFSGFAALAGHRLVPDPGNFDDIWAIEKGDGYGGGGAYAYATALLQVVYSYKGWENANYVMGELKNPQRTLKIAAPLAVSGITVLYVLANVAYFAAIHKADLAKSEVIVAGLFFRNMFGESAAARSLPAFVALSNIGNVLAVSFAHSRVNQELAREGILPWSAFWASTKPFDTPAASLFLHWAVTVIVLIAPPPGPAYNFVVNLYTYPGAWINAFVAGGLIYLRLTKSENWSSPWQTYPPVSAVYLFLNVFLVVTPFVPPNSDWNADGYPYYAFPLVGTGVLLLGGVYWLLWARVWPRGSGYSVIGDSAVDVGDEGDDGEDDRDLPAELLLVAAAEQPLLERRDVGGDGYGSISV